MIVFHVPCIGLNERCLYISKLGGEADVHLIVLSCGETPECTGRWTLRLLASELARLEIVESILPETVRRTFKNALKLHLREQLVILPEDAEFVSTMEEVLDLNQRPSDMDFLI